MSRFSFNVLSAATCLFAAAACVQPLFAQVKQTALVEVFTNSHCSSCPSMYNALSTHVDSHPVSDDVVYIFWHINTYSDDALYQQTKAESLPRASFYGNISGTPTAMFNGAKQNYTYNEYRSRLEQMTAKTTDIALQIGGSFKDDMLNIDISSSAPIPSGATLNVIVVENIRYKGRNNVEFHKNAMRKTLTGPSGLALPENSQGNLFSKSYMKKDLNVAEPDSVGIVVFLQNTTTKEVYQTEFVALKSLKTSSIAQENLVALPKIFPNPTSSSCQIEYTAETAGRIVLGVYSESGEQLATIVHEAPGAGTQTIQWDGMDSAGNKVATGVYFLKQLSGVPAFGISAKIILAK